MNTPLPDNCQAAANRLTNKIRAITSSAISTPVEKVLALSSIIMKPYLTIAEPDIKLLEKEGQETMVQSLQELYEQQLTEAVIMAIQYVKNEPAGKAAADQLRSYFLTQYDGYRHIAAIGDDSSFQMLLEQAEKNIQLSYYDTRRNLFDAICDIATHPVYQEKTIFFIRKWLDQALPDGKEKDHNPVLIPILCNCLGRLEAVTHATYLYEVFSFIADKSRSYSLNQAAGDIAIVLANLQYQGPMEAFHKFLQEFEWRYAETGLITKTRYAFWMLTEDINGALQYLADLQKSEGKLFAAAALSDMNEKAAIPMIRELYTKSQQPIHREVYAEALLRLQTQQQKPAPNERIIHLFGVVTQLERAGGAESDNLFIKRASEKSNQDLDILFESDE